VLGDWASEALGTAFGRISVPTLILHGTADRATKPEGSQAFFAGAGSTDKSLKLYAGHAHDLLNDLARDRVTNDIGNWIETRSAASVGESRIAA
jgi:alpha-beta hydrolase superfamily lysophospholipase